MPGIIGIVLTIGIAVDSNVLIYERIREEVRAGRTAIAAIDAGFTRALATILDSNITTFIAAAVLFFIGTGPVRGFAVTLGIGIITTVFTAFTLTRLIVSWWVRWARPQRLADFLTGYNVRFHPSIPLLRIVPDDTKFDFMQLPADQLSDLGAAVDHRDRAVLPSRPQSRHRFQGRHADRAADQGRSGRPRARCARR